MENLVVTEERFKKSKKDFDKFKSKTDISKVRMKSFENFLND